MKNYDFDFVFAYQESINSKLITSKHRMAEFLSKKGFQILYIEVPIFITNWIFIRLKNKFTKNSYDKKNEKYKNLRIIKPFTLIPTKFLFDNIIFANFETFTISLYLKLILKKKNIKARNFQIYIPKSINLILNNFIHTDQILYHLVDDFRYLLSAPKVLSIFHELSLSKATKIFTPSNSIAENISNKNTYILPHGFERYDFKALEQKTFLRPKNNILYYGQLNKLNFNLVNQVIDSLNDYNFIFIGNLSESYIVRKSNVNLINFMSHRDLMHILFNAQLLWCPFKINKLTTSMAPIKFIEGLSYGIPILSTSINFKDSLIQDFIEFKDTIPEHISFIRSFQNYENYQKRIDRINSVKERSWDAIMKKYFDLINFGN